ncbi:MAG: hypothetical protein GY781_10030 [Gammaproteobacteria bacterium]|nr:hypothetical protein [Gammaproteobacteria bacterium]
MKSSKNNYTTGAIIILSMFALPLYAQSDEISMRGPVPFSTYDINSNGLVSEEEFNTIRGKRIAARAAEGKQMRGIANAPSFSEFDKDSDGQLTQEELVTGQKAQREKRRGMNMGQGKKMGKQMRAAQNMPNYSDFDLNGDGKILEKEFYDARANRISERGKQGFQMRNLGNAPSFQDIDTNADAKISEAEFKEHQAQHRQQRQ